MFRLPCDLQDPPCFVGRRPTPSLEHELLAVISQAKSAPPIPFESKAVSPTPVGPEPVHDPEGTGEVVPDRQSDEVTHEREGCRATPGPTPKVVQNPINTRSLTRPKQRLDQGSIDPGLPRVEGSVQLLPRCLRVEFRPRPPSGRSPLARAVVAEGCKKITVPLRAQFPERIDPASTQLVAIQAHSFANRSDDVQALGR